MEKKNSLDLLNSGSVSLLISHLNNLKKNIEEIIKLKLEDKELSEIKKKVEDFLSWISPFKNEKTTKTNDDYTKREELIHELTLLLGEYFRKFDEDEKIIKLIKMSKFINDSKEIIDIINIYFDPTEEQKAKNQKNGNFSSLENNPFSIDVDESRYMNDFSRLFQDNENREPNDSMNKESITETEKNKKIFILDFSKAIKILITNFNDLTNSNKLMKYPTLENENDIQSLLNFFKLIFQPDSYNKSIQNISDSTEVTTQQLIENLNSLLGISEEKSENSDEFDDLLEEAFVNEVSSNKFDEIKKKIFFFINIISKENQKFTKKDLKSFSDKISKSLDINFADLFLIQNAPINNFAKCFNFKEISLKQNPNFPPVSKLLELQSIKYKLLIKDFGVGEENFDNTGNLLVPNTRQNRFRGKEIYDPPYNWLGLGLSVLGKFDDGNDDWLEDISEESEWAIAYRGISSKNQEHIKDMLKHFIEERNLEIARINFKDKFGKKLNDKRHWGTIESGIYMTPYIKIAEKYTKTISFNNKNYKVLLMAKVKVSEIKEPKNSNFWVLDNDKIRIYRVLFKEIN